jgi:hypothetical protein
MKNKLNLNPAFACNINLTNNIIMFYLFIDLSVLSAPSFTCCMISYVCFVQISWFSDSILGVVEERSLSMWDIYIYIRMSSGDAYNGSNKQQFYFWMKPLSSNK